MGDSSKSLVSGEILVKATGAEVIAGTNDGKFGTPKALRDAYIFGGSPVDHSADVAGYTLLPGETIYKSFTTAAGTSIPLYINTVEGIYEITIEGDRSVSISNNNNFTLSPNNTTYSGAIKRIESYGSTGGRTGSASSVDLFKIIDGLLLSSTIQICTLTKMKTLRAAGLTLETGPTMYAMDEYQAWGDTTTAWTSLGTLTLPFAQNIKMIIRRSL